MSVFRRSVSWMHNIVVAWQKSRGTILEMVHPILSWNSQSTLIPKTRPKNFIQIHQKGALFFFFFLKEQNIIIKLCLKKKIKGLPQKLAMACSVSCAVWVLSTHWKKGGDKELLVKDTVHFICIGCLLLDTLYYTVITSHPVSSTSRSLLLVKCVIVLKYLNSYCSTKNTHSVDQAKYFVGLLEFAKPFCRCTRVSIAAVVNSGKAQQAVFWLEILIWVDHTHNNHLLLYS